MGLRATLRLPTTPALLIALAVTLALSPILAVMNYMVGTHDSTTS